MGKGETLQFSWGPRRSADSKQIAAEMSRDVNRYCPCNPGDNFAHDFATYTIAGTVSDVDSKQVNTTESDEHSGDAKLAVKAAGFGGGSVGAHSVGAHSGSSVQNQQHSGVAPTLLVVQICKKCGYKTDDKL